MAVISKLVVWGRLIKFSHSIFALPFAVMMVAFIAAERSVSVAQILWLLVCVVTARTCAMAFNRAADAKIDALNPRTMDREIPRGQVARGAALTLVFVAGVAFCGAAAALGWHCFVLAPLVLALLCGYSYVKRFSAVCHMILGIALSLAPGGVWYALTAEWSYRPIPLMIGVALWVAGFDILYSCQDYQFDREQGLFSVPSLFGPERAKIISFGLHLGSVVALIANGYYFEVGALYWIGVLAFGMFLLSQHRIVQLKGIEAVDPLFLGRNGGASLVLCACAIVDAVIRGRYAL